MTIASEISRLQTAKADMKTAIVNKGVSVADSVSLSNYCDCINAIQAGGCYPYVIDALIIGGGGGGGGAYKLRAGGGGGGGGVRCLSSQALRCNSYCIVIGQGGNGGGSGCDGCDGGRSCIGTMFAIGGGGGGKGESVGHDGGSGGGGGMFSSTSSLNYIAGGSTYCNVTVTPRAGHDGGAAAYYRCSLACYAGGGGGACCMGGTSNTNAPQKCGVGGKGMWMGGGAWSSAFPNMYVSAGGGGGAQATLSAMPSSCPGGNGGNCTTKCGGNATSYGSGGGGAWSGCSSNNTCPGGNGCNGAVAIKYPKDGSYGFTCATGGTVTETSTCVYHLFTSNGTFCIIS